ncbi:hypothetical protein BDZ91DRAFT_14011 [Kalaharituber pfeilii]|nr:hypothetical protein BDZ91DRAFT_14011 [Kalaharituber pfeilii]
MHESEKARLLAELNTLKEESNKLDEKYTKEIWELNSDLTELQIKHSAMEEELKNKVESLIWLSEDNERTRQEMNSLISEKQELQATSTAFQDQFKALETELETYKEANLQDKLNSADREAQALKQSLNEMQQRITSASGSLNTVLNQKYFPNDDRAEINRSLEDAITEVRLLCDEVQVQMRKKFVDRGTWMEKTEIEGLTPVAKKAIILKPRSHRTGSADKTEGNERGKKAVLRETDELKLGGALHIAKTTPSSPTPLPYTPPITEYRQTQFKVEVWNHNKGWQY